MRLLFAQTPSSVRGCQTIILGVTALVAVAFAAGPRASAETPSAPLQEQAAEVVFQVSHAQSIDPENPRMRYELDVLKLALEKTRDDFGPYALNVFDFASRSRLLRDMVDQRRPNALHTFGYNAEDRQREALTYIRFPVYLGALGYRVCFISPSAKKRLGDAPSLAKLKTLRIAQGVGWSDTKVLMHHNFQVLQLDGMERMLRMTVNGQADLFCRGINEIHNEWQQFRNLQGLQVDSTFALYYPHPRFFYTHPDNKVLINRVETGLQRAHADGSLMALFLRAHQQSLDFVAMEKRRLFVLRSPLVKSVNFDFEAFVYHPQMVSVEIVAE